RCRRVERILLDDPTVVVGHEQRAAVGTPTARSSASLKRSLAFRLSPMSRHERYLAVFKLLQRRDSEFADTFDLRRLTASRQLACLQSHDLLREQEFGRFSSETRSAVQIILDG